MKNNSILSILALIFLVLFMQEISASYNDGTEVVLSADNGVYARDYRYVNSYSGPQYRIYIDDDYDLNAAAYYNNQYYGNYYQPMNYFGAYNSYNSYSYPRSSYYYLDKDNVKRYLIRQKISNFIDESAYSRYDLNYGRNSEVFCDTLDCQDKSPNPTNFRYKYAYDPRIDGTGSYQNYYYQPQQDPNTGAYNWRY